MMQMSKKAKRKPSPPRRCGTPFSAIASSGEGRTSPMCSFSPGDSLTEVLLGLSSSLKTVPVKKPFLILPFIPDFLALSLPSKFVRLSLTRLVFLACNGFVLRRGPVNLAFP